MEAATGTNPTSGSQEERNNRTGTNKTKNKQANGRQPVFAHSAYPAINGLMYRSGSLLLSNKLILTVTEGGTGSGT